MTISVEIEAWLRVALTPGVTPSVFRKLLQSFGGPEDILAQPRDQVARIAGNAVASALSGTGHAERLSATLTWLNDPANRIITLGDDHYPRLLLDIPDPPVLLYVKGSPEVLNRPSVAVVGSRQATQQGMENAYAMSLALAHAGITIVSGLAMGIDAAAHRGGLDGGAGTVAVVGTGLDIVYPSRNRDLAHSIAANGAIVSEYPLGTPPRPDNFPRRNRLISGMSRGCLVVEAAISSGSLITARTAADQGREVFAVPGSIHSPVAKGCHSLIKQGAKLVESAQDVLEELRIDSTAPSDKRAHGFTPEEDAESSFLLAHLGHDPCDAEILANRSNRPIAEVAAELSKLELKGLVESLPGARYQRVSL